MGIKVASVSETWMKDVFTDKGQYCGKVEDMECDLKRFKVRSLVVKATILRRLKSVRASSTKTVLPAGPVQKGWKQNLTMSTITQ